MSKSEKPEAGWLSLADSAAAFGMTKPGFHQEVRSLLNEEKDVRRIGREVYIRLRGAIDAYIADRVGKNSPKVDDPMLVGGDSPALERYREAKAGLAEMDLQERQKTHVNLRTFSDVLMRFAAVVRRAGEALQRRFGNEASEILNEAIDEALRLWSQVAQSP